MDTNPTGQPDPQMERIDYHWRMETALNQARLTTNLVNVSGYELFQCIGGLILLEQWCHNSGAAGNAAECRDLQVRLAKYLGTSLLQEAIDNNRRAAKLPPLPRQ